MALQMMLLGLMIVAALAEPEPKAEPAADPQYHPKYEPKYPQPSYPKPSYKPSYPAYPEYKPSYDYSYKKDSYYCDPRAPPRCANSSATFCLSDYEYPSREIQYAIEYDSLVLKKYADVPVQSADNLVDGVSSSEEDKFDYSHYNGKTFDQSNWIGGAGYICPSDVIYARPKRALNVEGEWRVIVQDVAYYTQTQRVETCLFAGASCRTLAPCHRSSCVQKYVYHRMLSFDPCNAQRGLFIDIYKLPSACSCRIPA
ncbi:neurotrophin 1 [Daphnia magna]|uniref:neurotrophin 1 n=1 Tax=Daphnia magna TaxID=35525 RepID=UPI001E1BC6A9|nr:neurotrophin 1 [Daphnia magna]